MIIRGVLYYAWGLLLPNPKSFFLGGCLWFTPLVIPCTIHFFPRERKNVTTHYITRSTLVIHWFWWALCGFLWLNSH